MTSVDREQRGNRVPYKGLDSYAETDAAIFCARDAEIEQVSAKIVTSKLLLLYAKSGAGKTSLIQAGIVPALQDRGFTPVYVRFTRDPVGSVIEAVKAHVERGKDAFSLDQTLEAVHILEQTISEQLAAQAIPEEDELKKNLECLDTIRKHIARPLDHDEGSILSFLRDIAPWFEKRPLVIVLDQFEELFTRFGRKKDLQYDFVRQLSEAFFDQDLPLSFVISIREDFLPDLELLKSQITSIYKNTFRLGFLTRELAIEAIIKPLEKASICVSYEDDFVQKILVEDLAREDEDEYVEPTSLQIVCKKLWDAKGGKSVITQDLYDDLGGKVGILHAHLESEVQRFKEEDREAIKHIFEQLIVFSEDRGTKNYLNFYTLYELVRERCHCDEPKLRTLLEELGRRHLVRREPRAKNEDWYELTHDALVEKIVEWRRKTEAEREERKKLENERDKILAEVERSKGVNWRRFWGASAGVFSAFYLLASIIGIVNYNYWDWFVYFLLICLITALGFVGTYSSIQNNRNMRDGLKFGALFGATVGGGISVFYLITGFLGYYKGFVPFAICLGGLFACLAAGLIVGLTYRPPGYYAIRSRIQK